MLCVQTANQTVELVTVKMQADLLVGKLLKKHNRDEIVGFLMLVLHQVSPTLAS
jgi:hypothetical protein